MRGHIVKFVSYCKEQDYISELQMPWLQYALEKRMYTFVIAIPFIVLGTAFASFQTSISFYICFSIIRTWTSGLHADTFLKCFTLSILFEYIFLRIIPEVLSVYVIVTLASACVIFICLYAPFQDPKMNFDGSEVKACAIKARTCTILLWLLSGAFLLLGLERYYLGIALGIVMAAVLLALAYIIQKGEF